MIIEKTITNYLLLAAFFVSCLALGYLIGDLAVHLRTNPTSGICNVNGRMMAVSCDKLVYCVDRQVDCK